MDRIKKVLRMPYVPAALLVSGAWFAGSAYWYTCQTQELCDTTEQTAAQVSDDNTELAPVIAGADTQPAVDVVIIDNDAPDETAEQQAAAEPETETPEPAVAAAVDEPAEETPADDTDVQDASFSTTQTVTAFYAPNQAAFARTGWEDTMNSFASHLKDTPSASVEIAGYAANVANSTIDEQELSRARAQALADYLVVEGVDPSQIDIVVKAHEEPIGDNATEEGRAKNRRAVVRFK